MDVAGFADGVEQVRLAVVVTGDETPLPQLVGKRASAVLVPNAGDLTWAGVDLTDADVAALRRQLAAIPDGSTRGVVWSALLDAVALASIDPRTVLALLDPAWVAETSTAILERAGDEAAHRLIPKFLPEREQEAARQRLAAAATRVLEAAEPESTGALVAAQILATTTADEGPLRRWLTGNEMPRGLAGDTDFRWLVLGNLGRRGLLDETELEQATVADSTMPGRLAALGVRASLPSAEAKAWAWAQLTERSGRSNHELTVLATAFWSATDPDLVRAYVPRFFEEVPRLGEWVGEDALARVIRLGCPRVIEDATARLGRRPRADRPRRRWPATSWTARTPSARRCGHASATHRERRPLSTSRRGPAVTPAVRGLTGRRLSAPWVTQHTAYGALGHPRCAGSSNVR